MRAVVAGAVSKVVVEVLLVVGMVVDVGVVFVVGDTERSGENFKS